MNSKRDIVSASHIDFPCYYELEQWAYSFDGTDGRGTCFKRPKRIQWLRSLCIADLANQLVGDKVSMGHAQRITPKRTDGRGDAVTA